jgi:hypothetical protein
MVDDNFPWPRTYVVAGAHGEEGGVLSHPQDHHLHAEAKGDLGGLFDV